MENNYFSRTFRSLGSTFVKNVFFLCLILLGASSLRAQNVTVTTSGSATWSGATSYATLAAAVADLNSAATIGGTGTVTFTYTGSGETAPAGGFNINRSATATANVVIDGGGKTFTAGTNAAGSYTDAIIKLTGADYITIQNFVLRENSANTVTTPASNTKTEFGIALFNSTATNGAQNNIIQNNNIQLDSAYANTIGIYSNCNQTGVTATNTSGTNLGTKVYSNTISNVQFGMYWLTPAQTATIQETGIDVGGSSAATANTITFGQFNGAFTWATVPTGFNSATFAGIYFRNTTGVNVQYNSITNASTYAQAVAGVMIAGTTPASYTYTSTISNNTITLNQTGTTAVTGIDFGFGLSTGTIAASSNNVTINQTASAATSAALIGIKANYASATNTILSNIVTINQSQSTGSTTSAVTGITAAGIGTTVSVGNSSTTGNTITIKQSQSGTGSYGSGAITYIDVNAASATVNVMYNTLNTTGSTIRSTGQLTGVNQLATITTAFVNTNNTVNIDRVAASGAVFYQYTTTSPSQVNDNVSNNNITFTNISGTSTVTAISDLGGASATGTVKALNSNTINISGTTTGTVIGIGTGYSYGNMNNNNITISTASATVVGIQATSTGAGAYNITGNTFALTSSSTSPTSMVAIQAGATGPYQIYSNTFTNLTFSGIITGSPVISGISVAAGTGNNVYNNTITNITVGAATSTASPIVDGILVSAGTSTNIYKNKIYGNTTNASGTSTAVNGIRISGSTTVNVYNNLIGLLTAPAAAAVDAIRGVAVTSSTASTSYNLYNNTIYLNASSTGANFGATGIFHTASSTATTAALLLQNNIVINTSTPAGTGVVTALRRSAAATYGNLSTNSARNMYFAGSPASNRTILTDGTNFIQDVASYAATAGGGRESGSFSDSAFTFESTTGANALFLKPTAGLTTQAESGGLNLASVFTDDFGGNARPTSPTGYDLGAWEFAGTTPAPVITLNSISPSTSPQCTATSRTVSVNVTTVSGTISSVTLKYNHNGTAQTDVVMTNTSGNTWTGVMNAPSTSNATVTWSVEAVNSLSIKTTFTGTSFADDPTNGITSTIGASSTNLCAGSSTTLTASFTNIITRTLGSNPTASSSTAQSFFPGGWGGAKTQYIILASELTALGLRAGSISSVSFTPTTAGQTYTGFQLWMGTTSQTAMTTTFIPMSGQTQVYLATGANNGYLPVANTLNTLTFGTGTGSASSFNWDGTSNIVLTFSWSSVPSASTSTASSMNVYSPGFTCSAYDQTDSVSPATELATTSADGTGTSRPVFVFTANIAPTPSLISWSNGTTTVGTGSSLNLTPASTATYSATATISGCTLNGANTVSVTVNDLPAAPTTDGGANYTQCGPGIPVNGYIIDQNYFGAGTTVRWYAAATGGSPIVTSTTDANSQTTFPNSINIVSGTVVYYAAVVDPTTGCESTRTAVTFTVNAAAAISTTGSTTSAICLNGSVNLVASSSASPAYNYSWTSTTGSGIVGTATGATPTVTPTAAGSYTYTVTGTNGVCTATATVNVTVNALPTVTTPTASVNPTCAGGATNLSATSLAIASGSKTLGAGATTGSSYDAIFYHLWGGVKDQYIVRASELTALGISAGNITSLGINMSTVTSATYAGFAISIGTTSQTAMTTTFISSGLTQVYSSASFAPTTGINTFNFSTPFNWNGTSNIVIQICWSNNNTGGTSNYAKVDATSFVSCAYYNTDSATPATVCSATTASSTTSNRPQFIFNGQVSTDVSASRTWTWKDPSNNVVGSASSVTVNPTSTTLYTVTATDTNNCSSTPASVNVVVNPLPSAPTATNSSQCGSAVPTASVSDNNSFTSPTFKWYSAASGGTALQSSTSTTYTTSISSTTTFYVSVTNPTTGCESARTPVTVTVSTPVAISTSGSTTGSICLGASASLAVSSSNANYSYSWAASPASGSGLATPSTSATLSVTPTAVGTYTYTVTATDAITNAPATCSNTATVSVTVNAVPNNFTLATTNGTFCLNGGYSTLSSTVTPIDFVTSTGNTLADMSTGTTTVVLASTDDVVMTGISGAAATAGNSVALPFTFTMNGANYTYYAASPDGWISLGNDNTIATSNFTNAVTSTSNLPRIYPYWDDLATGTNGYVRTKTFGTAPNRIFVVEWFVTVPRNTTGAANSTFQAWLYETSNRIEFRYGTMGTPTGTISAGYTISATNYNSITYSSNTSSTTTANDSNAIAPSSGRMYAFVPNADVISYSPTTGLFTDAALTTAYTGTPEARTVYAAPSVTTTYTASRANAAGCSFTKTSTVTINPLPSAPTATNSSQCGTAIPTASVADPNSFTTPTFKWYSASTGGTAVQSSTSNTFTSLVSTTTTYYVSVVNPTTNCESARTPVTITVTSAPAMDAVTTAPSAPVCPNVAFAAAVTPNSYSTFTWSASPAAGSGIASTITGSSVNITPTTAGTYTYTVVGSDGSCSNSTTFNVTVTTPPTVNAPTASVNPVCPGGATTLTATVTAIAGGSSTPPSTYCTADSSGGGGSNPITTVTFNTLNSTDTQASPYYTLYPQSGSTTTTVVAGQTYSLSVTCGTAAIVSAWIDFNRNGTFEASEWTQVYTSATTGSVNITIPANAAAGATYMRIRSRGTGNPNGSGDSCTAFFSGTSRDYVISINGVTDVSSSYTWVWKDNTNSTIGTSNSVVVNPTTTSTYTAVATDPATTCFGSNTRSVTVNPAPNAPTATNSSQCGAKVPTASVADTNSFTTPTYKWYNVSTGGTALQSSTSTTYTSVVTTTTTFYVSVVNPTTGCESARTPVTVTVSTPPAITLSGVPANSAICGGSNVVASVSSSDNTYVYTWSASPATGSGIATPVTGTTQTITPTAAGTYVYTVSADNGTCANQVQFTVTRIPSVSVTSSVSSYCVTGGTPTISLTPATGYGVATIQWATSSNGTNYTDVSGANGATYTPATAITSDTYYRATITNTAGTVCSSPSVLVPVYSPVVSATTSAGRCGTGTVNLTATVPSGITVDWYDAATGGNYVGTGASFSPTVSATTTYYAQPSAGSISGLGLSTSAVPSTTGASAERGMVFTATSSFILKSAQYYSPTTNVTNAVTVNLYDTAGTLLNTKLLSVSQTTAGWYTMDIGFSIVPGSYRLTASFSQSVNRDGTTQTFPIALSTFGSITNGYDAGNVTYVSYFHNVTLVGCIGSRVAATATVDASPASTTISYAASPYCSTTASGTVSLSGLNTGTFSVSPSGLTLNGTTGAVTPTSSTPGTYTVTYSIPATTYCSAYSTTATVVVNQAQTSAFNYGATSFCSDGGTVSPTFTGGSIAGTFTSSPSGLTLNGTTGAVTLGTSTAGTYTVANTVTVAGCTNSVSSVSFTVNNAVNITAQPLNQSKLAGDNASFSVTATATGVGYQWQVNSGSGWSNITGANAATLSLTAVTADMNGYQYRVLVSGTAPCSAVASTAATLTVGSAAITADPTNQTACSAGSNTATFTVTATSGSAMAYQWQVNTGSGWTDITNGGIYFGATTATLTLSGLSMSNNGWQFRVKINSDVVSNSATLTVKQAVTIGTQPVNAIACTNTTAQFVVAASGDSLAYQWQVNTGASWANVTNTGVYTGATTSTLNIANPTAAMNNYQYRVIVSGAAPCSSVTSNGAVLTVNTVIAITTQPASSLICASANKSFTVAATGTTPSYQWQSNTGSGWTNITNGGVYSGATTATLTVTGATTSLNGIQFRAVVSGATSCASVNSNAATLSVDQPAAPVITASSTAICNGAIVTLSGSTSVVNNAVTGTGTTLNSTTGYPAPYSNYYGGAKHQMIILASELTSMGLVAGSAISTIGMNVSTVGTTFTGSLQNFQIAIGNTTSTTLSTTSFLSGLTTVYGPLTQAIPTTGLPATVTHTLTTPFTWDGTSNIAIQVAYSNGNTGTSTDYVQMTSSTTATALTNWYRADGVTIASVLSAATPTSNGTTRPNITLGYTAPISWTASPSGSLYTNTLATTPYTGTGNYPTLYAKPSANTVYTATVTNINNCTNSSTTNITVDPVSVGGSISGTSTQCAGFTTPVTLTLSGYTGNITKWQSSTTADFSGSVTDIANTSNSIDVSNLNVTTYYRAVVTSGVCSSAFSSVATMTVKPNITYYLDADSDGFGNGAVSLISCADSVTGYVTNNTDCDDNNSQINTSVLYFVDADGDGYGSNTQQAVCSTTAPAGYATNNNDCDDSNVNLWEPIVYYRDADGDGYGTVSNSSFCSLTAPNGYSANKTDCDDASASKWRTADLYRDADGDGYAVSNNRQSVCYGTLYPVGYSDTTNGVDCDDTNASKWRTGTFFADADNDGFTVASSTSVCYGASTPAGYKAEVSSLIDCDDTRPFVYPGAPEICGNNIDDNCNGQVDEICQSGISNAQCNSTLPSLTTVINAIAAPGAIRYRYEITNTVLNNAPVVYTTASSSFTLSQAGIVATNATSYSIRVAVDFGNGFEAYSAPCTLTTPTSGIVGCDGIADLNSVVYIRPLYGATSYVVELTTASLLQPVYITLPAGTTSFTFSQFPGLTPEYGQTYSIRVAMMIGSTTYLYGSSCNLYTPSANLISSQCGVTLTNMSNTLFIQGLPNATKYKVRAVNVADGAIHEFITSYRPGSTPTSTSYTINMFTMSDLSPQVSEGATYRITIEAYINGQYYGPGKPCTVTTPSLAKATKLIPSKCGATLSSRWETLFFNTVPGASSYYVEVYKGNSLIAFTSDANLLTVNRFQLQSFIPGGAEFNTTYVIYVYPVINGVKYGLGNPNYPSCTVRTGSSRFNESRNSTIDFAVKAVPNPFENNFSLDLQTQSSESVSVTVFDMLGKEVESRTFDTKDLSNTYMGDNYAAGVYNVVVSQGGEVKTIRIIKR